MFLNILKKDLKRKKSMNIIVFVFITLCTVFMASSVGNMLTVLQAINFFGEQTNISDHFIFRNDERIEEFEAWLASNQYVTHSQKDTGIIISNDNLQLLGGKYETSGVSTINKLPEKYNHVLNANNEIVTMLKSREIAMSHYDAKRTGAKLGDKIIVTFGDRERTFTIAYLVKDMIYGSQYMDGNRLFISNEDYDYFFDVSTITLLNLYSVKSENSSEFQKDLRQQNFHVYFDCDKSTIESIFTLEMIVAAILIVVSVCLIVISLVILRFTIVFTLQDDYREIGIMKAIGIKNTYIKWLYIIKYFALSTISALVGVVLSIPFGNMLIENLKKNVAMQSSGNLLIGFLCGSAIVLVVILFCWLSAGKVKQFTAIQAIRNGSTGERFQSKRFFYLNKQGKIPSSIFMAINSIISMPKSYVVLVITFMIGTLLVILPLNAVNTLNGSNMIELFGISKSDAYIESPAIFDSVANGVENMMDKTEELKQLYVENGIDTILNPIYAAMVNVYTSDPDDSYTLLAFKSFIYEASIYHNFIDGVPPSLPNEMALTEQSMKKLNVVIGDSVYVNINGATEKFVITASFQSMNNLGDSMLLSTASEMDIKNISFLYVQCDFVNKTDIAGQIAKLKEITPTYQIKTAKELTDMYIGDITGTIDSIKIMLLCVVLFINCLITALLMRTFITKERGEIALLKTIGFRNTFINRWQVLRIMIVLLVSVIAGSLLSNVFNGIMSRYTFGLMGASKVEIEVVPLEVYFFYPLILFIGTSISAVISANISKKVNFKEINNSE